MKFFHDTTLGENSSKRVLYVLKKMIGVVQETNDTPDLSGYKMIWSYYKIGASGSSPRDCDRIKILMRKLRNWLLAKKYSCLIIFSTSGERLKNLRNFFPPRLEHTHSEVPQKTF